MAVYDQTYEPWEGSTTSRLSRIWAIARPGLTRPFKNWWTLAVMGVAFMIVGGWLLFISMISAANLPNMIKPGNHIFRTGFLENPLFSTILTILSATVGAALISRDLRHNALLMYFSRACSRDDYVAGEYLSLVLFLLVATLGPGLFLFVGQLGIGNDGISSSQRFADFGALLLHSLVVVIPLAAVVLACSSATSRPYLAGLLWAAIYFKSLGISMLLVFVTGEENFRLVSWNYLTAKLGEVFWETRGPIPPGLPAGPGDSGSWEAAAAILGAVTILSLAFVRFRVRHSETRE